MAIAAGTGRAWGSARAETSPGCSVPHPSWCSRWWPRQGFVLVPLTGGGRGGSLGFRLFLEQDNGLGASQTEFVSAQAALGHSFVGVGTSDGRVWSLFPQNQVETRGWLLLPRASEARQAWRKAARPARYK